jgi:hypothetical protein
MDNHRNHLKSWLFAVVHLIYSVSASAAATAQVAPEHIPGNPTGELPTELLQARAYVLSMERQMTSLEKRFPALKADILIARSCWKTSRFAKGCEAIDADIRHKTGAKGLAELEEKMADIYAKSDKLAEIRNQAEALDFLQLVEKRAKGAIEVPMVRGNLLWQNKDLRDKPHLEFEEGYTQTTSHTAVFPRGKVVKFAVPMSWKANPSENAAVMSFQNQYGHGNVWMTVLVTTCVDESGQVVEASTAFEKFSESTLQNDYERLGITLRKFNRTKLMNRPAIMFSRTQPFENLGHKATRDAEVIQVFTNGLVVNFQINTLGPLDEAIGQERLAKNRELFHSIATSMKVTEQPAKMDSTKEAAAGMKVVRQGPDVPRVFDADFPGGEMESFEILVPGITTPASIHMGADEKRSLIYSIQEISIPITERLAPGSEAERVYLENSSRVRLRESGCSDPKVEFLPNSVRTTIIASGQQTGVAGPGITNRILIYSFLYEGKDISMDVKCFDPTVEFTVAAKKFYDSFRRRKLPLKK